MIRIETSIHIAAALPRVWSELSDLAGHSDWMAEAGDIEFLTGQRSGVGTRMSVTTRVGPFRTHDVLMVTEWIEPTRIAVRHMGRVGGTGAFELAKTSDAHTEVVWREQLRFPWSLGSTVGEWIAAPILRRIFRRNLERLGARLESNP